MLTPSTDKGSFSSYNITKMKAILINQQTFIEQILQTLITCNPQNTQFTNQITTIQKDFQKSIDEDNKEASSSSFANFIETTESNIACIKIDIDQINKQSNENSEVITTLNANLQSLRDDFELFKMKKSTPSSPRKKNDRQPDVDMEKIRSDVDSLKNALDVINENYASQEDLQNCRNSIQKFDEIAKKLDDTASSFTKLSNDQQQIEKQLTSLQNQDFQGQIRQIKNDQKSQDSKLQQISDIQSQLRELKSSMVQTRSVSLSDNDVKFSQINKQLDDISNMQNKSTENLTSLKSNLEQQSKEIQKLAGRMDNVESSNSQNASEISSISPIKQQINELATSQNSTTGTINEMKARIDDFESKYSQPLIDRISQIEKSSSKSNEIDDLKQSLLNTISQIEGQLNESTNKQNNEIKELKQALSNHLSQIEEQLNQSSKQNVEIDEIKQTLSNNISQIEDQLKENANKQNNETEEFKQTTSNRLSQIEEKLKQSNLQKSENDEIKQTLSNQLNEIGEFKQATSNRLSQIEEQLKQNNLQNREIEELKQTLSNQLNEIEELKQTLPNRLSQIEDHLNESNNKQNNEIDQIKQTLSNNISQFEGQLNECLKNSSQQQPVIDRDVILSAPEIEDVKDKLNEVNLSQNRTIEALNTLQSKFEEQQNQVTEPLLSRVAQLEDGILDREAILNMPEMAEISERLNNLSISQNKTIDAFNSMRSKLSENNERVSKIEEQLNQIELPSIPDDAERRLSLLEDKVSVTSGSDDFSLVKDRLNEIAASQSKTIETVNILRAKLDEAMNESPQELSERILQIESQLDDLSMRQQEQQGIEREAAPSAPDDELVDRLNEVSVSQSKTIETLNALRGKLEEQQVRVTEPLLSRVVQLEEGLSDMESWPDEIQEIKEKINGLQELLEQNQMLGGVQERDVHISNDNENIEELQSTINSLSDDLRQTKAKLNSLNDQYLTLKGKIQSMDASQSPRKQFEFPTFSSDDNDEDADDDEDGAGNSKLRKRVSKLEKIVAHLLPAEKLKMKMIPIDFCEEIDLDSETQDETLRRHNHEISVLAKDFIVLSNEVIDLEGDVNELKMNRKPPQQSEQEQPEQEHHEGRLDEDFVALKERVEEVSGFISKINEMNGNLTSHVRENTADIEILKEQQKDIQNELDQFDQARLDDVIEAVQERSVKVDSNDKNEDNSELNENVSVLKDRVDELTSAFNKLKDVNNALTSHVTSHDSSISELLARQDKLDSQLEELDSCPPSNVESKEAPKFDDSELNDNLAILKNRVDAVTSSFLKLKDVNEALISHVKRNDSEVARLSARMDQIEDIQSMDLKPFDEQNAPDTQKMKHDISCLKYEVRSILKEMKKPKEAFKEREVDLDSSNNDEKVEQLEEELETVKEQVRKMSEALQKGSLDEKVEQLEEELETVKEQVRKMSEALQKGSLDEKVEQLEEELETVKEQLQAREEGVIDNDSIGRLSSQVKKLVDNTNSQTSYIRKFQEVLNTVVHKEDELQSQIDNMKCEMKNQLVNDESEKVQQIEKDIRCIKYEVKKLLSNRPASHDKESTSVESRQHSFTEQKAELEQLKAQIEAQTEFLHAMSSQLKKVVDNANNQTAYIRQHNEILNALEEKEGETEDNIGRLQHDIGCIKHEVKKLKCEPLHRNISLGNDQISSEKVGEIESLLSQKVEEIITNINQINASQKLIVDNANMQRSRIAQIQTNLSQLDNSILQVEERLDLIESNDDNNNNNNVLEKIDLPSSTLSENDKYIIRSFSQKVDQITSLQEEIQSTLDGHSDQISDLNRKLKDLQKKQEPEEQISEQKVTDICAERDDAVISEIQEQIESIEQRLSGNFIKISDAHQKIAGKFEKIAIRFEKIAREIKSLKEQQKLNTLQIQERGVTLDIDIEREKENEKNVDLHNLTNEFLDFKRSQEALNENLKKMIVNANQQNSQQIQNALNLVRNELSQRSQQAKSMNQSQNQNPNVTQTQTKNSEFASFKREIEAEMRKELNLLKNSISKSGQQNDEKVIASRFNQLKDEMISLIKQNDDSLRNECEEKSNQLSSKYEEIDEAKKVANRIVKIVKGHDEKLKKLKDYLDYQSSVLSEVTGRDIQRMFSRPATPK